MFIAEAPEEHHVMTIYKQSYLRLPTDYKDVNVEVSFPSENCLRLQSHLALHISLQDGKPVA